MDLVDIYLLRFYLLDDYENVGRRIDLLPKNILFFRHDSYHILYPQDLYKNDLILPSTLR